MALLENETHGLWAARMGPFAADELTLAREVAPALRGLAHEAALKADEDPGRLSFPQAVRVVQRRPARSAAIPLGGGKPCMKRSSRRLTR